MGIEKRGIERGLESNEIQSQCVAEVSGMDAEDVSAGREGARVTGGKETVSHGG